MSDVVLNAEPIVVQVELNDAFLGVEQLPVPIPPSGSVWSARVVTRGGGVVADLDPGQVSITSFSEKLNTYGKASITVPKHSDSLPNVELGSEIQIMRDGILAFWGVVVGGSTDTGQGQVTFTLHGLEWYFERIYFGSAERTNMLRNGSFEEGMDGWDTYGCDASSVQAPDSLRGDHVAVLYNKYDDDAFIRQFVPYYTEWPFGQRITVSGWLRVDASGPFVPGLLDRALYAVRWVDGRAVIEEGATFTERDARGKWVRLQVEFTAAPFEQGEIEVRGYYIQPGIRWDEIRMSLMESTSGDPNGNDQAELIRRIVRYAQTGRGKKNLSIGTDTPATGRVIPLKAWQHADHQPIMEAINEFVESDDGVDFSVMCTASSRTFTTFYPRRGVDLDLTLNGSNCASFSYSAEITRSANSIVVLGPSDGPTREEGGAWDYQALGGIALEDVVSAPQDASINSLDRLAEGELVARGRPIAPVTAVLLERKVKVVPGVGDRVNLDLDDGWLYLSGRWRVVERTFRPGFETVELVLVEELKVGGA